MAAPTGSLATAPKPGAKGVMFSAPLGTTLPEDATTPLPNPFVNLGYLTGDGTSNEEEIETEDVDAFGGDTVLTLMTSRKDSFTQSFLQALDKDVLKEYYGQDNVVVDEDGSFYVRHNAKSNGRRVFVYEKLHSNGQVERTVIPEGELFRTGTVQDQNGEARALESTVTAYAHGAWDGDTGRSFYSAPNPAVASRMAAFGAPDGAFGEDLERAVPDVAPSLTWTKQELADHAAGLGIEIPAGANKAEILAAIEAA